MWEQPKCHSAPVKVSGYFERWFLVFLPWFWGRVSFVSAVELHLWVSGLFSFMSLLVNTGIADISLCICPFTWVLGIKLESSGLITSAFAYWVIFPTSFAWFYSHILIIMHNRVFSHVHMYFYHAYSSILLVFIILASSAALLSAT